MIAHTNPTVRFLKAYVTALRIVLSYWWVSWWHRRVVGRPVPPDTMTALHQKNARRIEQAIVELSGLFIKVGQLFSIMTNVLPAAFRAGLERLQDSVPARPYEQIREQIHQDLGRWPEELFDTFEPTPVAAASLGQVHKARTKSGELVAVKVRHKDVEVTAAADLRTIWRIVRLVKKFIPAKGLDNYYHEIRAMVLDELDFRKEAAHIQKIRENFSADAPIVFPKVFEDLSGKRVLTLEFIDGCKISDKAAITAMGLDPAALATNLLQAYCQMIFVDGLYHADPHPGNLRVLPDGRIALLDFGAVGVLSTRMRKGLSAMMEAIIKGDESQLIESLQTMGFLRLEDDASQAATRVIEHFHRKFQEEIAVTGFSLSQIEIDTSKGFEHLSNLKEMNVGIRELSRAFHIPRQWVLLERTALQLTGICTQLDRSLNPAAVIRPYLEEFVLGTDRDWSGLLFNMTKERLLAFLALPQHFEKTTRLLAEGRLRIRDTGTDRASQLLYAGIQQVAYAVAFAASLGATAYAHVHGANPSVLRLGASLSGVLALLWMAAALRGRRIRKR